MGQLNDHTQERVGLKRQPSTWRDDLKKVYLHIVYCLLGITVLVLVIKVGTVLGLGGFTVLPCGLVVLVYLQKAMGITKAVSGAAPVAVGTVDDRPGEDAMDATSAARGSGHVTEPPGLDSGTQPAKAERGVTLAQLRRKTPAEFETWVASQFVKAGYTVRVTGGAGDHGIDIVVLTAGEPVAVVQCKRYGAKTTVKPEMVREFRGAMTAFPSATGYLITTGSLTEQAASWVRTHPIRVVDSRIIAQWRPERLAA